MKTKPARGFAITAGLITAVMLSTLPQRNEAFEFCTTRAFGFPFPWRVEWCLCERESNWPEQAFYWGANLLLASGAAAALTWVARALFKAVSKGRGSS
jgi:hypothetical protein